ncbi:MAG: ATP-binding protein [Victivallaceae bacterium]|nr:ATP-binding protein [Victivallaceae bacterium]
MALDSLIHKEYQLPPRLPVVFSGYEKDPAGLRHVHPNITGVRENLDLEKNIKLGFRLWPDAHEAIVLSDSSPDSLALEKRVRENLLKYEGIQLTFLDNREHTVSELFAVLRGKERHAFLIFPPWRELAKSDYQTRSAMATDLSANLQIPYLVLTDELLGRGAAGGYLVPIRDLAHKTTAMASQVLKQGSTREIPIAFQEARPYFDYVALKKAGVETSRIPRDSVIINRPAGVWERNQRYFIGMGGICVALLAAIGIYTIAVRRTLKRSQSLYASLPGRIGVLDEEERVLYLNTEDGCRDELKNVKFFRDIPNINYQQLSEAIKSVFETGQSIAVEYEYKSVKRIMSASLLDKKLFGEKTVVWFSQDNTKLSNVIQNEKAVKESLSNVMLENSFGKAFARIASSLSSLLACDRVMLAKCDNEGMLRFYDEWHLPDMVSLKETNLKNHYAAWDFYVDKLRAGKLMKFDDFSGSGIAQKFNLNEQGYQSPRSLIVTPILIDGCLWGALFVSFRKEKRSFSPSDEQLMYSMSDIIALARIRETQQSEIKRSNFEKQIILDHVKIPIWLHDGNGELLQANNEVARIAGVPAGSLNTENNREIFGRDFPEGMERPIPAVIRTHKPSQLALCFAGRDYISRSLPVFDEQQNLIYIVKSAIDVTELNAMIRMQEVVSFCLETFFAETDLNRAMDIVIKAICKYMDASSCFVMNFDIDKSVAHNVAEYVRPGCKPVFGHVKNRHFNQDKPWFKASVNHELISWENTKTQESIDFFGDWDEIHEKTSSIHVMGIFLEGKFWGNIGITFDDRSHAISDDEKRFICTAGRIVSLFLQRKKAQTEIISALTKAQDAAKAKSFFLASVSHEIRTPLNAVIGFSELLSDENLPQSERKEYLANIIYSGNALLQLINDVLDLSKLEADQMPIIREFTDFMNLCEENMLIFSQMAKAKNIQLKAELPELPALSIDKLRVRQIMFNLLGNAVKFTPQGSVTLWAKFTPDNHRTGTLAFGVTDTGIGIAESDMAKLLEPFVQLSKLRGTCAANNGTGLGLSICKRLIEKMNGKLSIESVVDKGSTFSVSLREVEYRAKNRAPEIGTGPEAVNPKNHNAVSVLLVDDVKINLNVMGAVLRKIGVEDIEYATSGTAAIALLKKRVFQVVMTDMWMPNMNGAELAGAIHALPQYRDLPVIAVTADVEAEGNFHMDNFAGVIFKPVSTAKCSEMLGKIISDHNISERV